MPWCPNCKTEYREGITHCADCKTELVADLQAVLVHNAKCNPMGKQKGSAPRSNQAQNKQFILLKMHQVTSQMSGLIQVTRKQQMEQIHLMKVLG